jgi:hypothetical protein
MMTNNTKARFNAERVEAGYKYLDSLRELMGVGQPAGEGGAPELIACPFCGMVPPLDSYYVNQGDKWGGIACGNCAVQGPEVRTGYEEWPKWKQAAINAWNSRNRPKQPVIDRQVAQRIIDKWLGRNQTFAPSLLREQELRDLVDIIAAEFGGGDGGDGDEKGT